MINIFANWKMYQNNKEAVELAEYVSKMEYNKSKINLAVFPTALTFDKVRESGLSTGAQNVSWVPQGAYTGAVSAFLFKEAGAKYALVGHSERRYIFGEKNSDVRKKVQACLDTDIIPVLCIGETREDREEKKTQYRIKKQILKVFEDIDCKGKEIIVAYEPVWAISSGGNGVPCTAADADDVIGFIKNELKQFTDEDIPVLYGGSVKAENVVSYTELKICDGVLVGAASSKKADFEELIRTVDDSLQ